MPLRLGVCFFALFFSFFLAWFLFFSYLCAFKSVSYALRSFLLLRLRSRGRRWAAVASLLVRQLCAWHPLRPRVVSLCAGGGCLPRLRWRPGRSRPVFLVGGLVGGLCGRQVVGRCRGVGRRSCCWSPALFIFLIFFNSCCWWAARMPPVLTGKKNRFLKKKSCCYCCAYCFFLYLCF